MTPQNTKKTVFIAMVYKFMHTVIPGGWVCLENRKKPRASQPGGFRIEPDGRQG